MALSVLRASSIETVVSEIDAYLLPVSVDCVNASICIELLFEEIIVPSVTELAIPSEVIAFETESVIIESVIADVIFDEIVEPARTDVSSDASTDSPYSVDRSRLANDPTCVAPPSAIDVESVPVIEPFDEIRVPLV